MLNPWTGILVVLATLLGSLTAIRRYQRLRAPHPEVPRKLLHVTMGLVTLPFPWLFDEAWPVLVLTALSLALLLALRAVRWLREGTGCVLHGVPRRSVGDLCFPVAVCTAFVAADGAWLPYAAAVLLLTFADPAAAWAGICHGQRRYRTPGGTKTVEGSLAFFATSGALTFAVLLAGGQAATPAFLLALLVAVVTTLVESASWQGLDNLSVPLVTLLLLQTHVAVPAAPLALELVFVGSLLLTAATASAPYLRPRATTVFVLVAAAWVIPPRTAAQAPDALTSVAAVPLRPALATSRATGTDPACTLLIPGSCHRPARATTIDRPLRLSSAHEPEDEMTAEDWRMLGVVLSGTAAYSAAGLPLAYTLHTNARDSSFVHRFLVPVVAGHTVGALGAALAVYAVSPDRGSLRATFGGAFLTPIVVTGSTLGAVVVLMGLDHLFGGKTFFRGLAESIGMAGMASILFTPLSAGAGAHYMNDYTTTR